MRVAISSRALRTVLAALMLAAAAPAGPELRVGDLDVSSPAGP